MKASIIEIGKTYYYGNCIKKFKCVDICTNTDKDQSDFVDYKKTLHRFYNNDMFIDKK